MALEFLNRDFIYFPDRSLISTPATIGLKYQDVTFSVGTRKLHGWLIPHPSPKATFLFFHGNAGNISHRLEKIKMFYDLGIATFIIDYSGYGKSEGKPSEKTLYEDGLAAYEALPDKEKVVLYGESLGTGVAIELALQKKVSGLILEGAFASLKDLAKRHMPLLSPMAGGQYNNFEKISQINVPIFFIHPKNDEICPFEDALKLYERAQTAKSYLWLESGGHNDAFFVEQAAYKQGIQDFLDKYRTPPAGSPH